MDFHTLARRELQALCKKNKIPANMTNVAMADALKALDIVEGIEEYMKPMESQTVQSSVESPVKSEVTSPCVPRTGGRSTCRRTAVKEEPETLPSRVSTRRSTRKGVAIETPALAVNSRRTAQASLVRRKVETQFEEEEIEKEKEKKTLPPTPAPLVTYSRRKGKEEESTAKKAYSTRRSVRLGEKNMETLKVNKEEKMETLKQELFTKETEDNLDMNLKQGSDESDKVSELSGVDMKTMSEDNEEKMDNLDVVDEEEREENDESENLAGENIENQLDLNHEFQENDGSHNISISEAENALENSVESDSDKDADFKDIEADNTVDDVLENKDDEISCDTKCPIEAEKEVDENSCDIDSRKETQKDMDFGDNSDSSSDEAKTDKEIGIDLVKDHESGLAIGEESQGKVVSDDDDDDDDDDSEADFDFIDHLTYPEQIDNGEEHESIEILEHEQSEQDADDQVFIATEESLQNVSSDEAEANFDFTDQGEKCDSIEILESEQSKQDTVQVAIEHAIDVPVSTLIPAADPTEEVQSTGLVPMKTPIKKTPAKTPTTMKKMTNVLDDKENLEKSESKFLIFTEKVKTPSKMTPASRKKITDVSDNKENLDSGKKVLILTKEKVKKAKGTTTEQDLQQLSLRKLTKMFKEKLQITNKSSKNENEAATATSRPALQALPENQLMVDEAQN